MYWKWKQIWEKSKNNGHGLWVCCNWHNETSTIESEEKAEKPTRVKTKDSIVGLYYCKKSGDTYVLNDDYSGLFLPKSGNSCTIDWYKTGNSVTVTFTGEMEFLGTQRLDYNKNGKFLIEKSEIYGSLKYTKQ